jgi:formylmethanofuran dehydrogenase subunit C
MKRFLLILALLSLPIFIWLFWQYSQEPQTLSSTLKSFDRAGEETKKDLSRIPSLPVTEDENSFIMQDDNQTGLSITYANQKEENQLSSEEEAKDLLSLSFPKDQTKPIEIKLDKERVITIQDLKNQNGFSFQKITDDAVENESFFRKLFKTNQEEIQPTYLTATNQRKTLLYTLEKDHATNEKKLKSWTLYEKGNGIEEEAYQFTNAKIKINDDGNAEVFYFGEKEIQNQQTQADVEPSLLERAQRVISQDMGEDILNSNKNPDFLIPKPFFYDKNGDIHETDWKYDEETKTLSLQISTKDDLYPIALDPTLAFTAPAQSNTGWVVTGEGGSDNFGSSFASGDFNADGKTDLAVGAYGYSTSTGRVYIFYNDGSISTAAASADVIITGESSSFFGYLMVSGDFNADGKTDLTVGAYGYSSFTGRAYLFYNGSIITENASGADIIITGETTSNQLGYSLASGDFNADGKTDLAVGANGYSTDTGRAYLFYNGSIITENASGADIIITGETTSNQLGYSLASGDFNADGKTDLAVAAYAYSTNTGRAYLFYNGSIITENASGADIIITGETTSNRFGSSFTSGDFNADGKIDLAVAAYGYSSFTGRAYIFYNGSIITENASGADIIITGEATTNNFGYAMTSGDFNADGKTDLAVGAYGYSTSTGRDYLFYNDGGIPTTAATADVIITGEAASSNFAGSLASGDFNADGKTDLAVGAYGYVSSRGRAYIFTSQNGQVNTNISLTGETTSNNFGRSLTSGDFNADGRTDLAVGAYGYSTVTGRTYIFYNGSIITENASGADIIITGETTSNSFGMSLTSGDFNADGKTDIAVGASYYSSYTGRAYIFYNGSIITENASGADIIITGETTGDVFGTSLASGDWNADGKTDLAVGAYQYSTNTGRAYLFYNGSIITENASGADIIITGETTNNYLGYTIGSGDWNADGKTDLVVGAYGYSTDTGRAYIFYNGSIITENASGADILITGETTSNSFGRSLASGDWNADGKTDLAVGAYGYSTSTGRTYIFYNGSIITENASGADIIITGEATSNTFGFSLASGDFNADGKTDLAVGAYFYSSSTGRAYLFYNDGSIPTTAATADIIIIGETTNSYFGYSLISGDFNADGKTDLAVGAHGYSTDTGRVYLYETRDNFAWQLQPQSSLSGSLRTNPSFSGQELKMTGEVGTSLFGVSMTSGDWNADGKTDLAVGASGYSTNTGRAYIFYSDGHLAAAATNADVIITGETTSNYFATALVSGDFNFDGKTDLAVGAYGYSTNTGRTYLFYNDGSLPTTAVTADVIITGETTSNQLGYSLTSGDFNADGKTDLAVGAYQYSTQTGRAYIFYNGSIITENASGADILITGQTTTNYLGYAMTSGDFNADGKTDLAVGAYQYSTSTGRAYIFYNGSIITENASGADILITGETTSNYFAISLTSGDFNADGKTDLAVGADGYSTLAGRAYIFYNGSIITESASGADVIITGEASSYFGYPMVSGDFNADGRTDLAVGAYNYSSATGRTYIFYNDGSIPTTAATADVIITGETTNNYFSYSLASGDFNADGKTDLAVGADGYGSNRGRVYMYTFNDRVITGEATNNNFGFNSSLASGDFNADGKTDLAVGAYGYSTSTGRAYIFYNDGSLPTTAATADVIITGEASSYFGSSLASGDWNADGKTDLAVGTSSYSASTGRVYIFYNDGSIPTDAASADIIITGEATSNFGFSLASGDFNADGKTDLAVGAYNYSSATGRAYIFYNGSIITENASGADVTITGETTSNYFGYSLASGDFNADGKTDLAVGAYNYSSATGRAYLFYNGSIITENASGADVTITGETTSNNFGFVLTSGDFNADSKTDLAVAAYQYSTNTGRVYLFYNGSIITENASGADVTITGETTSNAFGYALTSGDFNADSKTDLAVGAYAYSSTSGRAYIFYNDGSLPTTAAAADIIITGETTSNNFGSSFASGDFNADGKTDLAVGAWVYSSNTGRVYIFITEAKSEEALLQFQSIGATDIIGNFEVR